MKSVGLPKLGGPFQLTDQDGRSVSDQDLLGNFVLLYFGFTHCPDICPEELKRMAKVIESIDPRLRAKQPVLPVFVSVDPKRDTVDQMRLYVQEFHPKMVGLTGTPDQVAQISKAYRVYASSSQVNEDDMDYLVDHSIFIYLLAPDGSFIDYFGRDVPVPTIVERLQGHMSRYAAVVAA